MTLRSTLLLLALLALSMTLFGCANDVSDRDIVLVDLPEVSRLRGPINAPSTTLALVDPRTQKEYDAGHIPGAIHIPLPRISAVKGDLTPELAGFRDIVVYGNDPGSAVAPAVTKRLMLAGHKRVRLFRGGLAAWREAGLAIERVPEAEAAAAPVP